MGVDVGFSAECHAIAQGFEVLHDAVGAGFGEGVIRIGSAFDRIETGVDVVPCGRTHGCRLEAVCEPHVLSGQSVDVWCAGLATIASEVAMCAIIGDDEHEVGVFRGGPGRHAARQDQVQNGDGGESHHRRVSLSVCSGLSRPMLFGFDVSYWSACGFWRFCFLFCLLFFFGALSAAASRW